MKINRWRTKRRRLVVCQQKIFYECIIKCAKSCTVFEYSLVDVGQSEFNCALFFCIFMLRFLLLKCQGHHSIETLKPFWTFYNKGLYPDLCSAFCKSNDNVETFLSTAARTCFRRNTRQESAVEGMQSNWYIDDVMKENLWKKINRY